MVSTSVSATTDTTSAAAAMKKTIGMNKDDFLKMFITQLKNQDPLSPSDPTQMLNQLSQLTQLEQAYNTNSNLQSLLAAQNSSTTMNSVSFIGKTVKANGNSVVFDGTATTALEFSLDVPADSVSITISDAAGRPVRSASLSGVSAGDVQIVWDGRDGNGNILPAGGYTFSVAASTASGATLPATTYTTGKIDSIKIVNGAPYLTIGPVTVALADIISIKGA